MPAGRAAIIAVVEARTRARLLAPLALVVALVAVVVVVQASSTGTTADGLGERTATQRTTTQSSRPARRQARAYVVKAGDTLTGVAERTGVALDTILELNPDVDPNALQTGQRLKLR